MIPRFIQIRDRLVHEGQDWHGRPLGDPVQAALGQLWEEWRDNILGVRNGYRDVWKYPDPFYDTSPQRR